MPRPISATISLSALRHNLSTVMAQLASSSVSARRATPQVWAVMKADAYGHGLLNALGAFVQAHGVAMLDMNEAVRCRQAGWTGPLLLLEGFFEPADILVAAQYDLTVTVHTQEQLDMLMAAHPVRPLDVFMKLNSGMNRLGFAPKDYRQAYHQAQQAQVAGQIRHLGKMTHFASADVSQEVTAAQIAEFNQVTDGLPGGVSVCNSAATLTEGLWTTLSGADAHWVRPGICLYGASPFAHVTAHALGLRPAQTLAAELISVSTLNIGDAVGYGQLYTAESSMRIGVVACGYADGYPRHAPTGTPITVDGTRTRILGRVSMDMLVADLTPVPQARVGSNVVLWGRGGPSVDEVAQASGTIGYELLCAVAPRVPRLVVQ